MEESKFTNARDTIWNNCFLTTCNKRIRCCFNNRIAHFTTIVNGISFFNYHGDKFDAARECTFSYTYYAIRDSDGGKGNATRESSLSDALYAVGDGNRGKGGTIKESITSYTCYAIRDGNRGKRGVAIKSIKSNVRDTVGDNGILATSNKGIGGSLNNCIAIFATIIYRISTFNDYGRKGGAACESVITQFNARYAVRDSDGG